MSDSLDGCRQRTLKRIHCRSVLVAICVLVVVECACVLTELMVDLQGIKFRFENEAQEIQKFVAHLRYQHPQAFEDIHSRDLKQVLNFLKTSVVLRSSKDIMPHGCLCSCPCWATTLLANHTAAGNSTTAAKRDANSGFPSTKSNASYGISPSSIRDTTRSPRIQKASDTAFARSGLMGVDLLHVNNGKSKPDNENDNSDPPVSFLTGVKGEGQRVTSRGLRQNGGVESEDLYSDLPSTSQLPTSGSADLDTHFKEKQEAVMDNSAYNKSSTISSKKAMLTLPHTSPPSLSTSSQSLSSPSSASPSLSLSSSSLSSSSSLTSWSFATSSLSESSTSTETFSTLSNPSSSLKPSSTSSSSPSQKFPTTISSPQLAQSKSRNKRSSKQNTQPTSKQQQQQQPPPPPPPATAANSNSSWSTRTHQPIQPSNLFVLEINNMKDNFFLVAEFLPNHLEGNSTKHLEYSEVYNRIYRTSKTLHFTSVSILAIMVLETAIKLFCTGFAFFKKKLEVFDAFIVISSFALDVMFLDSRWYETGKDATALLALLLPWRVVRIVNSFLMTMKHKHNLQVMNLRRGKKKAELKIAKLHTLLSEVRKDVQLLVALCRYNAIDEQNITSCLYGKGRRGVTLSAMSTCTSLMLISTLGKDAVQEDDIYGKIFKEILNEGDQEEVNSELKEAEEAAIEAAIRMDDQMEARKKSKRQSRLTKALLKRSYTVPRRCASVEIPEPEDGTSTNVFYIPDGDGSNTCSSLQGDFLNSCNDNHVLNDVTTLAIVEDGRPRNSTSLSSL